MDATSTSSLGDLNPENSSLNGFMENIVTTKNEFVEIIEQPAPKALRFRYECEGRSAGSIPGTSSTLENKTYPTIRVMGYKGRAVVVVSCVTKEDPYRPHPHNLVGRDGCKKGVCTLEIPSDTMTISFSNLGIQCVKKKDIEHSLKTREEIRVDPFRTGFNHRNHPTLIDLNSVRLCFQVFLEGDKPGKFTRPLPPAVSEPIFDKKATADLIIVKLSDCNSYVDGGRKDIILLCEKVSKEDIQIRFFEEKNGIVTWEAYGDFQSNQVHKQTAIWFRAPRYPNLEITEPVKAFIQLKRPSDGATSEALPFEFLPLDAGRPSYWSLGRCFSKKRNYSLFNELLNNKVVPPIELPEDITKTNENVENIVMETNNNEVSVVDNEKNESLEQSSLNQLIDEVAELDELYSLSKPTSIEIEPKTTTFDDSKTYSSLQLAFKNPLNVEFIENIEANINTNKRESPVEKLPPLPPKRQKRIETYIGEDDEETKRLKAALLYPKPNLTRSHSFNNNNIEVFGDDSKYLGSTSTLPNPKKRSFLSKLFGRKKTNKSAQELHKRDSYPSSSSVNLTSTISKPLKETKQAVPIENMQISTAVNEKVDEQNERESIHLPNLDDMNLDLTEAEHYALYTAMAPHATQSEFDEMSCYYAPVEGGKILS